MSPINFESLARDRPDLQDAWIFLKTWLVSHPRVKVVPIDRLAKAAPTLSAGILAQALAVLLKYGMIQVVYRVKDSDGTLLDGDYSSPGEVPSKVARRLNEGFVAREDTDIVPVYCLEETRSCGK